MAVLLRFASDFAANAYVPLDLDIDFLRVPRSPTELGHLEKMHAGAFTSDLLGIT
eukprot:SAG31_NODE_24224_length_486_cov_1.067183_2_plen_54_part_01